MRLASAEDDAPSTSERTDTNCEQTRELVVNRLMSWRVRFDSCDE